jgi:hypothetical protein
MPCSYAHNNKEWVMTKLFPFLKESDAKMGLMEGK